MNEQSLVLVRSALLCGLGVTLYHNSDFFGRLLADGLDIYTKVSAGLASQKEQHERLGQTLLIEEPLANFANEVATPPRRLHVSKRRRHRRSKNGLAPQQAVSPDRNKSASLFSIVTTREVETRLLQFAQLASLPSVEDRLKSVRDEWLAETPIPIRSEVHKRVKPLLLEPFPERRQKPKQKKPQRFEPAMLERILLAWLSEKKVRSGVELLPGREDDVVRIDKPTWRKLIQTEIPDASEEIVEKVIDAVHKLHNKRRRQAHGRTNL